MTDEKSTYQTRGVVYPRFLGVDDGGDFVWELADGRWTWGDNPYDAAKRGRTFTPDRYQEKYGLQVDEPFTARAIEVRPEFPGAPVLDPVAEAGYDPGPTVIGPAGWPVPEFPGDDTPVTDQKTGAVNALAAMERAAKLWATGSAEEEKAHKGAFSKGSDEQEFMLADILQMIDDAAREVGVAPVYSGERTS